MAALSSDGRTPQYYMIKQPLQAMDVINTAAAPKMLDDLYTRMATTKGALEWLTLPDIRHGFVFAFACVPDSNPQTLFPETQFSWGAHSSQTVHMSTGELLVWNTSTNGHCAYHPGCVFTRTRFYYLGGKTQQHGLTMNVVHYSIVSPPGYTIASKVPPQRMVSSQHSYNSTTPSTNTNSYYQNQNRATTPAYNASNSGASSTSVYSLPYTPAAMMTKEDRDRSERLLELHKDQAETYRQRRQLHGQLIKAEERRRSEALARESKAVETLVKSSQSGQQLAGSRFIAPQEPLPFTEAKPHILRQPEPPVKAVTPYMAFSKEMWAETKAENSNLKFHQIGSIIGDKWRNLPEATRKRYAKSYDSDKERYRLELEAYEQTPEYLAYRERMRALRDYESRLAEHVRLMEAYKQTVSLQHEMRSSLAAQSIQSAATGSGRVFPPHAESIEFVDVDEEPFSRCHVASSRYRRNHIFMTSIIGAVLTEPNEDSQDGVKGDDDGGLETQRCGSLTQLVNETELRLMKDETKDLVVPNISELSNRISTIMKSTDKAQLQSIALSMFPSRNIGDIFEENRSNLSSEIVHYVKAEQVPSKRRKVTNNSALPVYYNV